MHIFNAKISTLTGAMYGGVRRHTCLILTLGLSIVTPALQAEDNASATIIGQRNNYTGVFPADCTPVTTWAEYAWKKKVTKDARGRSKPNLVLAKPEPVNKNIVWRTPIVCSWNGAPIVAGGKVFVMRDRGGIDYSSGLVPDFMGSELVCLDPVDGKVLWRYDCHHIDLLPEGDRKQAAEDLKAHNQWWPKAFGAWSKTYGTFKKWKKLNLAKASQADKDALTKAAEVMAAVSPGLPTDLEKLVKHPAWPTLSRGHYIQVVFEKLRKQLWPEEGARMRRLRKWGYEIGRWQGQPSFCGHCMSTPASDGKHIYVHTGNMDAYCLTLDGKLVWSKWFGPRPGGHNASDINSVYLLGDIMVVRYGGVIYGLNKTTGDTVWMYDKIERNGSNGNAVIHPLRIPKQGGGMLDVIIELEGTMLRASDGKVLMTGLCSDRTFRVPAVTNGVLIARNGLADGGSQKPSKVFPTGIAALRFEANEKEGVSLKISWTKKGKEFNYNAGIIHEGLVYLSLRHEVGIFDLETGSKVGSFNTNLKQELPPSRRAHHVFHIAGKHMLWTDSRGGSWSVSTIGPKAAYQNVNHFGDKFYSSRRHGYFNEGGQAFFSGNRMFYCGRQYVVCVGDPEQQMRLSSVHQ